MSLPNCPFCTRSIAVTCPAQYNSRLRLITDESFEGHYVKVWGKRYWIFGPDEKLITVRDGLHEAVLAINTLTQAVRV